MIEINYYKQDGLCNGMPIFEHRGVAITIDARDCSKCTFLLLLESDVVKQRSELTLSEALELLKEETARRIADGWTIATTSYQYDITSAGSPWSDC